MTDEKKQPKRASLADVARKAGVDPSTASRALKDSDSGRMRPETRERIRAIAEELNYRPHRLAQSLRQQRTGALLLIVPSYDNLGFTFITRGVQSVAFERDYNLFLEESRALGSNEDSDYRQTDVADRVDGILLAAATQGSRWAEHAARRGLPLVFVNRRSDRPDASPGSVIVRDDLAVESAIGHLVEHGHKRIGYFTGPLSTDTGARRLEGFNRAMERHGLPVNPNWVHDARYTLEGGASAALRLLEVAGDELPTAMHCGNLVSGLGVLRAFTDAGVRVPEDVSLIAIDEHPLARITSPPFATVEMPLGTLGQIAAGMMIDSLDSGSALRDVVVEDTPIVHHRESVKTLLDG